MWRCWIVLVRIAGIIHAGGYAAGELCRVAPDRPAATGRKQAGGRVGRNTPGTLCLTMRVAGNGGGLPRISFS